MKRKLRLLFSVLFSFFVFFAASSSVGGESLPVYPYQISVIYQYENTISAVDIVKTSAFSSKDDTLIVFAKQENGSIAKVFSAPLDENLPVGTTEITLGDFEIGENQTVFVTIWDDLISLKPLTDGTNPPIFMENNRVYGDEDDWLLSSDGKRILAYTGQDNDIIIPNYIGDKHITMIAPNSTPDDMKSIFGDRAGDITSVKISDGIKKIGPTAFFECKNATNALIIPTSVDYIGAYAFYNCINMTGDLVIPDNVQYINPASFAGCFGISSLKLPDNLKSVGSYGFFGCKNISGELKIPETVSRIEPFAFANCLKISGNLSLPGVIHIGNAAFLNCTKLTGNLEFSDSLETIGFSAFEYCNFTGTLTLPESLTHIGDAAFNHCSSFDNGVLIIPKNVRTLGGDLKVEKNTYYSSHLFYDFCRKNKLMAYGVDPENDYFAAKDGVLYDAEITRLIAYPNGKMNSVFEIPEGVTQLDELSFSHCFSLKELILPDSYVISNRAPANVVNQDGNTLAVALYNYTGIEKITVKESNPNYVSKNGALYSKDGKSLWYCPIKIGESYKVEEGTERIETGAIYGVNAQTRIKDFEIPASVRYIAPETVERINYLFEGHITVDDKNTNYCTIDGKLKAVN